MSKDFNYDLTRAELLELRVPEDCVVTAQECLHELRDLEKPVGSAGSKWTITDIIMDTGGPQSWKLHPTWKRFFFALQESRKQYVLREEKRKLSEKNPLVFLKHRILDAYIWLLKKQTI